MTLPTEIDQDVKCVDCGAPMVLDSGDLLICAHGKCLSQERIRPKTIAALRNQRTPGTTEIPNAELERLREARSKLPQVLDVMTEFRLRLQDLLREVDAILAHLPAKQLSCDGACDTNAEGHRGRVRAVICEKGRIFKFNYCDAAIEEDQRRGFTVYEIAAIEKMEKQP